MNEPAPGAVLATRRHPSRVLRGARNGLIYAFGFVFATIGTMNVPGTMDRSGDELQVTDLGVGIYLLSLIAWGSIFLRRRSPLFPLIAGAVLATIGTDYLLLLIGAHGALVSWPPRRRRQVAVITTGMVIAFTLRELLSPWGDAGVLWESLRDPGADEIVMWGVTILLAVLSLLVSFGSAVLMRTRSESRAHLDRADQEHSRAAALSTELGRQSERERLARDIHDALAHRLSVISLQSGALEEATRSQDESVARAALALRQQAHASLDDLRGLLGELRRESSAISDDEASAPPSMASMRTIGHLIRSVREGGAAVDAFVLIEGAEHAGAALDRTTYRVVQESLTNALKHAPSAPIAVYVEAAAGSGVRIRVSNPIVPSAKPPAPGSGRGVLGIRERAQLLGGTAWTGESDGQFIIDVTLPWPDGE